MYCIFFMSYDSNFLLFTVIQNGRMKFLHRVRNLQYQNNMDAKYYSSILCASL